MTLQQLDVVFEIVLMIVATPAAVIAAVQLIEMRRQRAAEMSWSLFETYSSQEMVESRTTLYLIRDSFSNVEEYLAKYHNQPPDSEPKAQDYSLRYRLRYFHQAGLLVRKRLVDIDLLFGLVGFGLKVDYEALRIVAESYRQAHDTPMMYDHFDYLYRRFLGWEAAKRALSTRAHSRPRR